MNHIKRLRLRAAIPTQKIVANTLGLKQSTVGKWELGKSKPRTTLLPKIAELYNCTIEELLMEEKND